MSINGVTINNSMEYRVNDSKMPKLLKLLDEVGIKPNKGKVSTKQDSLVSACSR